MAHRHHRQDKYACTGHTRDLTDLGCRLGPHETFEVERSLAHRSRVSVLFLFLTYFDPDVLQAYRSLGGGR